MNTEEVWRDVPGFEGLYVVSNYGRVKALSRIKRGKGNCVYMTRERILKPQLSSNGYYRSALTNSEGKVRIFSLHRLVAMAFIPNPNKLPQVNHINENKQDNSVDNIEWSTASHNINWGTRNDRVAEKMERAIIAIRIKDGKELYFKSISEAKRLGYSPNRISKKVFGRYIGMCMYETYVWKYADDDKFEMPKLIDKRKKVVATSTIDGSVLEFCSIHEAKRNGFDRNSIKYALRNKTIYKNYYWEVKQ